MIFLVPMALAVWLLGMAPPKYGLRPNNYKNYLILAGTIIVLITGLRTPLTGSPDTYRYTLVYDSLSGYSDFRMYYDSVLAGRDFLFSETGFYFTFWLLARVFPSSQMVIFASMAFATFAVCRFIHKNSRDPSTALLIYVCLGLLTFNMNGMRQAMAMSVCLFAYEYVKKQKLLPFILVILVAMQFHKTAICFLPVFLLPMLKKGKNNTFLYIFLMGVVLLAMDWFIETFNAFTGEEYEVDNEAAGGGLTVVLIYVVAIVLAMLVAHKMEGKTGYVALWGSILGLAFYVARYFSNQILERISYYYFYFVVLLIPEVLAALNQREKELMKIVFCVLAILLLWYRTRIGAFSTFTLFFLR